MPNSLFQSFSYSCLFLTMLGKVNCGLIPDLTLPENDTCIDQPCQFNGSVYLPSQYYFKLAIPDVVPDASVTWEVEYLSCTNAASISDCNGIQLLFLNEVSLPIFENGGSSGGMGTSCAADERNNVYCPGNGSVTQTSGKSIEKGSRIFEGNHNVYNFVVYNDATSTNTTIAYDFKFQSVSCKTTIIGMAVPVFLIILIAMAISIHERRKKRNANQTNTNSSEEQQGGCCVCCIYKFPEGPPPDVQLPTGKRCCKLFSFIGFERPTVDYSHWWRSENLFLWPWNPTKDEKITQQTHRVLFMCMMLSFQLLVQTLFDSIIKGYLVVMTDTVSKGMGPLVAKYLGQYIFVNIIDWTFQPLAKKIVEWSLTCAPNLGSEGRAKQCLGFGVELICVVVMLGFSAMTLYNLILLSGKFRSCSFFAINVVGLFLVYQALQCFFNYGFIPVCLWYSFINKYGYEDTAGRDKAGAISMA